MKWVTNPAVGDKLRDSYRSAFGEKGRLWHVRGIVDDQVVMRVWNKHKRRWIYQCVTDFPDMGLIGYRPDGTPPLAPAKL